MQRRPTVGPGSQWPPCGNVSPEQFPNWVRVRHCRGGQMGGGGIGKVRSCVGNFGGGELTSLVWLAQSPADSFIKGRERMMVTCYHHHHPNHHNYTDSHIDRKCSNVQPQTRPKQLQSYGQDQKLHSSAVPVGCCPQIQALRNANICNANPSILHENTINTSICQYKYPKKDMCASIYNVILASSNINALQVSVNADARQASENAT